MARAEVQRWLFASEQNLASCFINKSARPCQKNICHFAAPRLGDTIFARENGGTIVEWRCQDDAK
jgi:hypothetical protein